MEALNGRSGKSRKHTGALTDGRKRQAIITALANGESKRGIARRLSMSANSVTAIADEEWNKVEARKQRLAAQAELNATLAADQMTEELRKGKIPLNILVPVFGVNVDKAIALRGDPLATIQVNHDHRHMHLHAVSQEEINEAVLKLRSQARETNQRAQSTGATQSTEAEIREVEEST